MNNLSKIILLFCFYLLFFQPAYAEDIFKCTYSPESYPILTDKDGNIVVQGKIKFCVYPKDAKMSALFEKIKDLPEKEKLKIPEYLVAQEFLAIQREDLPAIYELFTQEEQKRAKEFYGEDIDSISRFFKGYTDLKFDCKSYFGNYVRITYNCISPQGKTFPAWCYVKFVNGRYYVTRDIEDYESESRIFRLLSSNHPWDHYKPTPFKYSDEDFMVNLTYYAKDEEGNDIKENPVKLSYNSSPYPPDHSIFKEENRKDDEEAAFLYKVVKIFPEANDEEILNLWHPDDRKDISELLRREREENVVTDIFQFRSYFEDIEDIYIVDKIFSKDGVIIYYEPIIKGKKAPLQTIIFKRDKGKYCLWSGNSMKYPKSLLQSKFILQSIKERLNQRRTNS